MSDTIVDMPKVTQMLDAGWRVTLYRVKGGSYAATAEHDNPKLLSSVTGRLRSAFEKAWEGRDDAPEYCESFDWENWNTIITDDFTPEQALTRLAYKVHGEVI